MASRKIRCAMTFGVVSIIVNRPRASALLAAMPTGSIGWPSRHFPRNGGQAAALGHASDETSSSAAPATRAARRATPALTTPRPFGPSFTMAMYAVMASASLPYVPNGSTRKRIATRAAPCSSGRQVGRADYAGRLREAPARALREDGHAQNLVNDDGPGKRVKVSNSEHITTPAVLRGDGQVHRAVGPVHRACGPVRRCEDRRSERENRSSLRDGPVRRCKDRSSAGVRPVHRSEDRSPADDGPVRRSEDCSSSSEGPSSRRGGPQFFA